MKLSFVKFAVVALLALGCSAQPAFAQVESSLALSAPIDTISPARTMKGYVAVCEKISTLIVEQNRPREAITSPGAIQRIEQQASDLLDQATSAMDLTDTPPIVLERSKLERVLMLCEVLRRVDQNALAAAPTADVPNGWAVPGTPISIDRIGAGKFLFSLSAMSELEDAYLRAKMSAPKWGHGADNVQLVRDNLGHITPGALARRIMSLPEPFQETVAGNMVWQWLALVLTLLAALALPTASYLLLKTIRRDNALLELLVAGIPIIMTRVSSFLSLRVVEALNLEIDTHFIASVVLLSIAYLAWLWWLCVFTMWISKRLPTYLYGQNSLKVAVARLTLRFIGIVVIGIVLARGLAQIGVPLFGILAGLGVGGLALALAAQPTVENLIAGIILFVDQPARVGDECEFEGYRGVVEEIGIRSTSIRLNDGTLMTLTNSEFCNMKIRNLGVGQHQFCLSLPLAPNVDADRLSRFLDECKDIQLSDANIKPGSATVELDVISAAGIFVRFTGIFTDTVRDPAAAWQRHQIGILGAIQRHELQLAEMG